MGWCPCVDQHVPPQKVWVGRWSCVCVCMCVCVYVRVCVRVCKHYLCEHNSLGTDQAPLCVPVHGFAIDPADASLRIPPLESRHASRHATLLSSTPSLPRSPGTARHATLLSSTPSLPRSPGTAPLEAGLRWDLDNTRMAFGGLVSTSNIIDADEIEVHSDSHLVWTVELKG